MGNCALRTLEDGAEGGLMIKVMTCSGGVMELHPPVTAECITNGFPAHGIYRCGGDILSKPLLHNEELIGGELYYLRPLGNPHVGLPSLVAPYRVSFDHHWLWRRQEMEVQSKYSGSGGGGGGVWKVKLVIRPAQLVEILSQEARTEALINSVRTVAKCGGGAASMAGSDQLSLVSSRKACSESYMG